MPIIIISLIVLSLFLSIYVFIVLLLILGVCGLLAYINPKIYKNKIRSILTNLFTVLFSFLIIIVIAEVYLHLVKPSFLNITYSFVGEMSDYQNQGNLDQTSFIKQPGTFRILGLGDSFAVSDYRLKKNYHNYLSLALKAAGYENTEVVNAGVPGIGPGYYWYMLNKFGDRWKPDVVLVGFFVGNDFEESEFIMHLGPYIQEPRNPVRRWWSYRQFQNFWVYKLIRGKLILARETRMRAADEKSDRGAPEGSFSHEGYLEIEKTRMWIFKKDNQARLAKLWPQDAAILLKMQKWCAHRQVPLVIAIFPDQFQVDRKLRQEIYQTYHLQADNFDLSYPNKLIVDFCRQQRLHCLDLLGPFQKLGASQTLYKLRDSHWNAAGNRLAADSIFAYLTKHGLAGPRQTKAALPPGGRSYH